MSDPVSRLRDELRYAQEHGHPDTGVLTTDMAALFADYDQLRAATDTVLAMPDASEGRSAGEDGYNAALDDVRNILAPVRRAAS